MTGDTGRVIERMVEAQSFFVIRVKENGGKSVDRRLNALVVDNHSDWGSSCSGSKTRRRLGASLGMGVMRAGREVPQPAAGFPMICRSSGGQL